MICLRMQENRNTSAIVLGAKIFHSAATTEDDEKHRPCGHLQAMIFSSISSARDQHHRHKDSAATQNQNTLESQPTFCCCNGPVFQHVGPCQVLPSPWMHMKMHSASSSNNPTYSQNVQSKLHNFASGSKPWWLHPLILWIQRLGRCKSCLTAALHSSKMDWTRTMRNLNSVLRTYLLTQLRHEKNHWCHYAASLLDNMEKSGTVRLTSPLTKWSEKMYRLTEQALIGINATSSRLKRAAWQTSFQTNPRELPTLCSYPLPRRTPEQHEQRVHQQNTGLSQLLPMNLLAQLRGTTHEQK